MDSTERAALWTFVGIFVVFKVVTTAVVVALAPAGMWNTIWFFIAFHWPPMVLALFLGVAPLIFWWRLVRVRAKRARLLEAEWRVDAVGPHRERVQ